MNQTLIVYYSLTGTTEKAVNTLLNFIKADTIRLIPEKEIKKEGFFKYMWGGGQVVMKQEPKLKPFKIDFDQYQHIIIGTPIWAWTFSPPVRSFLKTHTFKHKNIYYLYTHEGGDKKVIERFIQAIPLDNQFAGALGLNYQKDSLEKIETEIRSFSTKHQLSF
jgi:flavodoxin